MSKPTTLKAPKEAVKHGAILKHSEDGTKAVVDHGVVSCNSVIEIIHYNERGGYWRPRSKHKTVTSALMKLQELTA